MREFRDKERKDDFPYGRPTVSAWIAAAAVAFAFFVLGGFIKTYRQLESLREESRREIRDLRALVDSRRARPPTQTAKGAGRTPLPPPARRTNDPAPPRNGTGFPPEGAESLFGAPPRAVPDENGIGPPRLTYSVGRAGGGGHRERPLCQVISVSGLNKRLIVEGGRNLGFDEGARLELSRQGRWIGDLRVLEVFDVQSSCEILHATMPPEPGDLVRIPR